MSSCFPSILIGFYAPIDSSDGSGMNLLDIKTCDWNKHALNATAPNLLEKLGKPVRSHNLVGNIS